MSEIDALHDRLVAERLAARTAPEIAAAMARVEYYNRRYKGCRTVEALTCPEDDRHIPAPTDIGAWLSKCPAEALTEADTAASETMPGAQIGDHLVLPEASTWQWMPWQDADGMTGLGLRCAELPIPGMVEDGLAERATFALTLPLPIVHVAWLGHPEPRPRHPLAPLVAAWQEAQGNPPAKVTAVVLQHAGLPYLRTPGLMAVAALTPVETVIVDGEPFGSAAPMRMLRTVALPPGATDPEQLELLPGPRTLDDAAVDPVLAVLSGLDWMDGRSPLRSDILTLVRLGCAILSTVRLDVDGWARVLRGTDGRVQPEARRRAQQALSAGAVIVWHNNKPYQMVRAVVGDAGTVDVLPSAGAGWWDGGRGTADAWRLSGGLWRRHWAGPKQGGHRRMAEGIETALAWSPPAGRVKNGRLPQALRPDGNRRGNPGPEYFIGWQRVMYLSGEPYPDADDRTARRNYQRRVADFEKRDYMAKGRGPAPAGDTWEITRRVMGQTAGLFVRASARYVEAVRRSQRRQNFTTVRLDLLLRPPLDG